MANWLGGRVHIPKNNEDGGKPTPGPSDVTSVYERILKCLKAPNYAVFSNTTSQCDYNASKPPQLAVSLEVLTTPSVLLSECFIGKGPITQSMRCNETAGFDASTASFRNGRSFTIPRPRSRSTTNT